ncbi:MAG TPA: glycosyltransferase family 39 protein [Chloroflexota bacterium]|nr:glycosyltransferase family 39 protein [Chloroflexota bacterium]
MRGSKDRQSLLVIVLLALAGWVYLFLLLPERIGVGADTVIFYGAAHNLQQGQGLTLSFDSTFAGNKGELMTHFPPLFPALLAGLALLAGDVESAAWFWSITAFSLLILAIGLLVRFYCPHTFWPPVLAAFFTLSAATTIRLYTVTHSESLFLLLWLSSFFLLDRYGQRPYRSTLVFSALLAGLTFLTRYAGIAFILTGSLWLLLRRGWKTTGGWLWAATYGFLSLLPMLLWLLYAGQSGSATNRDLTVHWIADYHVWQGVYTVSAWSTPDNIPLLLRLVVWLVMFGSLGWLILRRHFSQAHMPAHVPDFFKLLLLNLVVYLAFIVFSISFMDIQIRLTERILSPVYLSLLLLGAYGITIWWSQAASSARRVMALAGSTLCLAYLVSMVYTFADIRQNGEHYTGVAWRDSETLAFLQASDGRTTTISNGPDIIYYYTGLPALAVPAQYHDTSMLPNEAYEAELQATAAQLASGAQLVLFQDMAWRWFLPDEPTLLNALPLQPIHRFADGTIYIWDGE